MDRKPDRTVILAGDAFLVDVKVGNLNIRVRRKNNGARISIRDLTDSTRESTILMPYHEPADFAINGIQIGEWEKWMEKTENYRSLDTMLAYIKHYEDKDEPRKVSEIEGGPFPKARCLGDAVSALADAAVERAESKKPTPAAPELPGGPVDMCVEFPITADMFFTITGRHPEMDDLERCNCTKAGDLEHWSCGMCRHGLPVFLCEHCFSHSPNLEGRQVCPEETGHGTG